MAAPKLDKRSIEAVIASAEALASGVPAGSGYLPDWSGVRDPRDPGRIGIELFARLMELLIERENRIPEKHFLEFLDFVGVERSPGTPARVPVTFLLAKDARNGAVVPAGTQVATTQTEAAVAQVFETEGAFFASQARIALAVALAPGAEGFARIPMVDAPPPAEWLEDVGRAVTAFDDAWPGLEPVPHRLYLGSATLFERDEAVDVVLDFTLAAGDAAALGVGTLRWHAADAETGAWTVPIDAVDEPAAAGHARVRLRDVGGLAAGDAAERSGFHVRATLDPSAAATFSLPLITSVHGELEAAVAPAPRAVEVAFANDRPIDLSKPFLPFGARPRYGDVLYLGSTTAFGPEVESVEIVADILPISDAQLTAMFTGAPTGTTVQTLVEWQYLDSSGAWSTLATFEHEIEKTAAALPVRSVAVVANPAGAVVVEGSPAMFGSASVDGGSRVDFRLPLPLDIGWGEVNGQQAYWLRAILRSRDPYGMDGFVVPGSPPTFVGPLLVPPTIEALQLLHTLRPMEILPDAVLSDDGFAVLDRTEENAAPASSFAPFRGVAGHSVGGLSGIYGDAPALYLGFDRPLEAEFVSLFVHLDEAASQASVPLESGDPQIACEVLSTDGSWHPLDVEDRTYNLTTSGTVAFRMDERSLPVALFASLAAPSGDAEPLAWIRLRLEGGSYDRPPRVLGVFFNTAFAENRTTFPGNTLVGSGSGKPGQTLQLVKYPVLAGELWVREPERPSQLDLEVLRDEVLDRLRLDDPRAVLEPEDLIEREGTEAATQDAYWVRWHRVPNFAASGPTSRHYTLDPVRGALAFGNGERGSVSPPARDNLVMRDLQIGGGDAARIAAGPLRIKELKTSLPFVSKVFNVARATGGSDPWTVADVQRFGPQAIKNRGRAVTTEDFEWMVQERFGQAAKVRALATRAPGPSGELVFRPGAVTVIVVPRSEETLPRPSNGLIAEIREYLRSRTLGCINAEVHVIGPTYRPVSVRAVVHADDPRAAGALGRRVALALTDWLHPVSGMDAGTGWRFGRPVRLSEVFAVIASVAGVDHVSSASFDGLPPGSTTASVDENALVASGIHHIEVV